MRQIYQRDDVPSTPRHILSHTGLRGVAAILVVLYHAQFGAGHKLALKTTTTFFSRGYLWVDLFFILSGFIISYTNKADHVKSLDLSQCVLFILQGLRVYIHYIYSAWATSSYLLCLSSRYLF